MAYRNTCNHFSTITNIPVSEIVKNREVICADCDCRGPNLWICLYRDCLKIGCSENYKDHSTEHNHDQPMHCIHMNLSTKRIWCYQCQAEVFMDFPTSTAPYSDSDQETEDFPTKSHDSGHGSYSTLRTNTPDRNRTFPFDKTVGLNVGMNGDSSESSDGEDSARLQSNRLVGLVGLQNIGNTCYMNAALQALSNTIPLTNFFLDCPSTVKLLSEGRKPGLSRTYLELMKDMWIKKNGGYVTPSGILYGIRNVYAMFRGYHQHDTQEFLRNFMDQLHEELKQLCPPEPVNNDIDTFSLAMEEPGLGSSYDSSEGEYETCDSGVSERSSLSDDAEHTSNTTKRKLSRSTSPGRRLRARMQTKQAVDSQPSTNSATKKPPKYRSVISDVFDGKLLSSVQCLTCDRISSRIETFQDLSLPIPSKDHLMMLHGRSNGPGVTCSEAVIPVQEGWLAWILAWLKSWFYGPTVSLHDCLAAFFSTDELKGDNMYSCERCNKLRNGIKFSKVMQLPEVLCIHLKRFRHELMFSSKISSFVSFPLKNLDMRPYLHANCISKVTTYDLFSVICHHGTAGGGHYTCYSLNNGEWYEFDDQYVTKVSPETVQNCEAYVLFYRKNTASAEAVKNKIIETAENAGECKEFGYVSKQWLNRFYTFAEPGPIDNSDFLCQHGSIHPERASVLDQLAEALPKSTCDLLYRMFGGCPPVTAIHICPACQALLRRVTLELETFLQIHRDFQNQDMPPTHLLAVSWFTHWQNFVQKRISEPPGPIDNSKIVSNQSDSTAECFEISESIWIFFHNIYGGGPEIRIPTMQEQEKPCEPPEENTVPTQEEETEEDVPGFVIPWLRKTENSANTIDSSMYSHGEPMETETEQIISNTNEPPEDEVCQNIENCNTNESESSPESNAVPNMNHLIVSSPNNISEIEDSGSVDKNVNEEKSPFKLENKYKQHLKYKAKQKNRHIHNSDTPLPSGDSRK